MKDTKIASPFLWLSSAFIAIFIFFTPTHVLSQKISEAEVKSAEKKFEQAQNGFLNDLPSAIKLLNQAKTPFEKAKRWEDYINCLNFLSFAYYNIEAFDSFEITVRLAHNYAKKYQSDTSQVYITTVANMATVYDNEGNYQKSIFFNQETGKLQEKYFQNKYAVSITYSNIAYTYSTLGDYDESINYLKKALELAIETSGKESHDAGRILREIANAYKAQNKLDKALEYYQKSLSILDKLERVEFFEQTRWYAYVDLAEIYLQQGDKKKALDYANKAKAINAKYDLLEDYKTWQVLGKIYQSEGNYQLALNNFNQQKKATEKEYSMFAHHPQKALAISNIASVYVDMKDYSTALKHYQEALKDIAAGFNTEDTRQNPKIETYINKLDALTILGGKAKALSSAYKTGKGNLADLKAANDCYSLMAKLINSIRQGYLAEGSKHTLSEKAVGIYEQGIGVALELHRATGQQTYLEQAFALAESNKAVLLFESIRDQMAKGFAGIPDSLLDRERDLQAQISFYEKKLLESQQKTTPDAEAKLRDWENKVFELKEARNKFNQLLESRYPDYFHLKYQTDAASIAAIRDRLPSEDAALVEYMLGPHRGYVFFLTKKQIAAYPIKDRSAIEEHLSQLREIISQPPTSERFANDFNSFSLHASALYGSLLKEGLEALPNDIEQLVIIPDDVLNYLPFEVLLRKTSSGKSDFSPKSLDYLFEDYAISYHYSATLLTNTQRLPKKLADESVFLGYAPSFGEGITSTSRACTGNQLSNLSCNQQEVAAIQKILGGKAVFSNAAISKAFLLDAPNFGILHLATHACIDDSSPSLNKIFFTDDFLPQIDLDQMRLNAALTVLSACNTGSGKLQHGEGVISMARSFLLAGSASVLTSFWSVDDCTTSDIMLHYYQFLKKGYPKDEAIQKARLAYLKGADMEGSHPYYWAAFVQFGDASALDFGWKLSDYKWAIGATVLALAALPIFLLRKKKNKMGNA